MISNSNDPKNGDVKNNDSTDKSDDTLGENTGSDSELSKSAQPNVQDKPDEERVETVTPGFDKGHPGPPSDKPDANKGADEEDRPSSNKGQGPSGENL